jgi:hypothetical protein
MAQPNKVQPDQVRCWPEPGGILYTAFCGPYARAAYPFDAYVWYVSRTC